MAASANSITLADYALFSNSPLVKMVSYSLLTNSSVLDDLPIKPYKSMIANGVRFVGNLPAVNWRAINDVPAVVKADPTPFQEQAYVMANTIAIDNKILQDQNAIQDPWALQLGAYFKAAAYKFNDVFINNSHVTGDANAPVGLRFRLDNPTAYGIPTEMKIAAGGSTIDISAGSNGDALIETVQQALDVMGHPDGTGVSIYMNELTRRKMDRAIKKLGTSGGLNVSEDQFGRRVMSYNGALIKTIGRKADQTTQIITSTETTAGVDGSSNYSSMYFVAYGDEDMSAWNFEDLESSVVGPYPLTASGVQSAVTIDWGVGLLQTGIRSVARVYGIKTS